MNRDKRDRRTALRAAIQEGKVDLEAFKSGRASLVKREHTMVVGRYKVTGEYDAASTDDEIGRLCLHAAIAVLSRCECINGDELCFARKAMGLRESDLARLLDVAVATVSRWETGADSIQRQTQLAVLFLVEHTTLYGEPTARVPGNPIRVVVEG